MDTSARETSAAAAAMMNPLNPEDAPAAGNDETDPFAGSGDEASSEEYAENPGKAMARHVISGDEDDEDEDEVNSADESGGEMAVDGDDAAEPVAASTPARNNKETFRIITIEAPTVMHPGPEAGEVPGSTTADANSGDVNHAAAAAAASAAGDPVTGNVSEVNSAGRKKGDGPSAKAMPQMSDVRSQSEAGSAKTNAARKSDGKSSFKIPSICPPPSKIADKQAAEADAVPSASYKAILNAKENKLTPPVIPGTGPATAKLDCGSFYNTDDNRIRRPFTKRTLPRFPSHR
jgi:hypothetical protein